MIVLYTDGLIERSDRPLQAGLDELLAMIDRLRDEAPDTVASSLAYEGAGATGAADDVCVLALRLGPRARRDTAHEAAPNRPDASPSGRSVGRRR